ncbi:hypothetical protein F4804DRAFT_297177 [Jackrogersella minutella]|nr:hypothetical protein F4804DRAFT_297177 [Jackrogersella minutella]
MPTFRVPGSEYSTPSDSPMSSPQMPTPATDAGAEPVAPASIVARCFGLPEHLFKDDNEDFAPLLLLLSNNPQALLLFQCFCNKIGTAIVDYEDQIINLEREKMQRRNALQGHNPNPAGVVRDTMSKSAREFDALVQGDTPYEEFIQNFIRLANELGLSDREKVVALQQKVNIELPESFLSPAADDFEGQQHTLKIVKSASKNHKFWAASDILRSSSRAKYKKAAQR